jgi:Na+/H+ antiporter NhaD/arsenite permease-like protein
MFVPSGALARTGLLALLTYALERATAAREFLLLPLLLVVAMAASAFMNNTPVVLVMIPAVMALARRADMGASRLLIPLSYASILGGTCTLIGTSTNLVVDGVARAHDLDGFSIFEISLLGLVIAAAGAVYLLIV